MQIHSLAGTYIPKVEYFYILFTYIFGVTCLILASASIEYHP